MRAVLLAERVAAGFCDKLASAAFTSVAMTRKVEVSIDDFRELASCGVCFGIVNDPWILPCYHHICYEPCLTGLLQNRVSKCPTCRKTFHHTQLKPFYFFRDLINKAKISELDEEQPTDAELTENEKDVASVVGKVWTSRELPPQPTAAELDLDAPPPSAQDYEAERLAFIMANDPNFVPVSQRPPHQRRCPRWPICDSRNCPYIHPNRLCMDLECPGGEVCDLVHADTFLSLLESRRTPPT